MKRLPINLRVLVNPRQALRDAADEGRGFTGFLLLLALEFALGQPETAATALARIPTSPLGGISSLWGLYLNYALPFGVGVFGTGLWLHYRSRRTGARLEVWKAASVAFVAFTPHTVWVLMGTGLGALGVSGLWLPQYSPFWPAVQESLGGWMVLKLALEAGPFFAVVWWSTTDGEPRPLPFARPALAALAVLTLVVGGVRVANVAEKWGEVRPIMRGDLLSDVHLTSITGRHFHAEDLVGKVTLIDFWATWCTPCVVTMPALQEVHQELGGDDFQLLSVNVEPENPTGVARFVDEHGLTFPVYTDHGPLQRRMGVLSYPTAFLLDRSGRVHDIYIGATDIPAIKAAAQTLVKQ